MSPRLLAALLLLLAAAPSYAQQRFDLLIRNGAVIDGSGAPRIAADIGLAGDRIAAIGDLSAARGAIEIDALGRIVAPGFINIHDHADPAALPTAANMLAQGVTSEIMNADGSGPVDIDGQLDAIAATGSAVNFGAQIGFNAIWRSVMGETPRRATESEIARMQDLLVGGLAAGAFSISAGLEFSPVSLAQADDVVAVLSAARPWRTSFANHERLSAANGFSSLAGIGETIAIAERAGLRPVITHIKLQGHEQGRVPELLALFEAARARNVEVAADIYPYIAGQTGLADLLIPAWAQAGGREAMLARLRDPAQRPRVVEEVEAALAARFGGPSGVFVLATREELTAIMARERVGAGEAVIRTLEARDTAAILRFGVEADLEALLAQPGIAIACDCGATREVNIHPRSYGTFPRVLQRYVGRGVLSLEAAIAKMTSLPARIAGFGDRGLLRAGSAADIVIFDPVAIGDVATFDDPARLARGVDRVIVNGRIAWQRGAPTGIRAGRALRRAAPNLSSTR